MKNYVEEIRIKGIAIANFDTEEQYNAIITKIEKMENVDWFITKYHNQSSVVIKPRAILTKDTSLKKLSFAAKLAYTNKEYNKSLEIYQNILLYNATPKIYARIGMCFYNLNKLKYALEYLNIANSLDNNLKLEYIIQIIEKYQLQNDAKKASNNFSLYNVDNYEEIISSYQNNENLSEIFNKLNLDFNQRSLVYIAFAKEYYHLGMEKMGDKYLHLAEKQPDKNKFTNLLISEVRKMKKLYIYKDVPVLLLKKPNFDE